MSGFIFFLYTITRLHRERRPQPGLDSIKKPSVGAFAPTPVSARKAGLLIPQKLYSGILAGGPFAKRVIVASWACLQKVIKCQDIS